jgi:tetratricopeptide (TPR) repeat protein
MKKTVFALIAAALIVAAGPLFSQDFRAGPDGESGAKNDAESYLNSGRAYSEKGDYDRAVADFDQAISIDPDYAEAYYNRGTAYSKKEDYDRAMTDFDRAISIDPDYAKAYNNRGCA